MIKDPAREAQHEAQIRTIAVALGQGWCVEDVSHEPSEYHYWQLHRLSDGLRFQLEWPDLYHAPQSAGRLGIRLVWPCYPGPAGERCVIRTPYQQAEPVTGITVDEQRPAQTIAKEILRRLVNKDATRLHTDALYRIGQRVSSETAQQDLIERIIREHPGAHTSRNCGPFVLFMGQASHAYQVRVDGADSVRFEAFSVPAYVALNILAAMKRDRPICQDCGADPCVCEMTEIPGVTDAP